MSNRPQFLTTLIVLWIVATAGCAAVPTKQPNPQMTDLRGSFDSVSNNTAIQGTSGTQDDYESGTRSAMGSVLLYLPNRLLDLMDIVRARVRVGPGAALGLRATRILQGKLGAYATIFAGLPGPRGDQSFRSPIGLELYTGAALSLLELQTETFGPNYSATEFGADIHALLLGLDVGFDPVELLDFILGIFFIDIKKDDL